jgi:thioredoxin reductase (NADPH)
MFTAEELKQSKLFSILSEPEIVSLAEKAADVRLAAGEWLIREGEPPYFHILLEGRLQMVKDVLGRPVDITHYEYRVGDFFGETPILLGTQNLISLRAETACRLARLDRQQLQNLIRDSKEASALILQTMNDRVLRVQQYVSTLPSARVLILARNTTPIAATSEPFLLPTGSLTSVCRSSWLKIWLRRYRSMERSSTTRPACGRSQRLSSCR